MVVPGTLAAGTKTIAAFIVLSNPGINETVRRTRGILTISSDQSGATEDQIGAMGMIVVTNAARVAGAASIPGPGTDASDDGWFVWQPFSQKGLLAGSGVQSLIYEFDSKAMRRVEEGFEVVVMIENNHATNGLVFSTNFSLLTSLT